MSESPAPLAPLQVKYRNTPEDWAALQKSLTPRQRFMLRWGTVLLMAGFVALCCLPATVVLLAFGHATAVLGGWVFAAMIIAFMFFLAVKSWRPPDPEILRPATLELQPEFLEVYGDRGWERRDWALIDRLQETDELIIIHRDDALVYAVPRRAFDSPADQQAFVQAARRFHERAKKGVDLARPAPWQDAAPAAVFAADTLQVTYSTAAPELAELKQGMVLHSVSETPQKKTSSGGAFGWIIFGVVVTIALFALSRDQDPESNLNFLMAILAFPLSAVLMAWPALALFRFFRRPKPAPEVTQTLTISPAGVSLWSPRLESRNTWEAIDAVQENDKVIVFATNRPALVHAYTVPKSAFPDEFEARHFAETAARYCRIAHDAAEEAKVAETPRPLSDNPYQPPLAK